MFAFSSRPTSYGANGNLIPAVLSEFSYGLDMVNVQGTMKGFNVCTRVNEEGKTECYLCRYDYGTQNCMFPCNTVESSDGSESDSGEDEADCVGMTLSCNGSLRDFGCVKWVKSPKFVPTGRIKIYGAVPGRYSVSLSIKRYKAQGGCYVAVNKKDCLEQKGTDVLTGIFELSEADVEMKCGVNATVDLSFLLDPKKNEHAPNWEEDGVAWGNPTLTLQCVGVSYESIIDGARI